MLALHYFFAVSLLSQNVVGYNVDVLSPYVIKTSSTASLFGFSTALHIDEDRSKKYILVGAPRAKWTTGAGSAIENPGAVYKCELVGTIGNPTDEELCIGGQILHLTDNNKANAASEDKANQWLGVNVQSTNGHVSACAHRYIWKGEDETERMPIGKCIVIGPTLGDESDGVDRKILFPCKDNSGLSLDSVSCQVGTSQMQYLNETSGAAYLLYGAPGMDIWEGSAYLAEGLDSVKFSKNIDKMDPDPQRDFNQYNGYAVAICSMTGSGLDFITAAPRANNYLGALYFFNSQLDNTNEKTLLRNSKLNEQLTGDQMGAYYGYSLACGDVNNDGTDDLLVSAPWYSMVTSSKSSIISVGRVYVYYGHKKDVVENAATPTIIQAPSTTTSAFGVGLAYVGDINVDGLGDFAIGAPYENDYKGAVYIYHGSYNGIKTTPAQTIRPTNLGTGGTLGANLRSFGWAISANKDMDNNGYPDMAIGSYMSDRVVYLRSLPIVDLNIEIVINSGPVDLEIENYTLPGPNPQTFPGTQLKICFTPNKLMSDAYEVEYTIFLDYKKQYAPRAFFQDSTTSQREFTKEGVMNIDVASSARECTDEWIVYLKKSNEIFDDKSYIDVNMVANIKESDDIATRAVLKQEQVSRAKAKIVIKSICLSPSGICQCDIELKKPTVEYIPAGYDSVVLGNVNQVIVNFEVENKGPDDAHIPTLRLELPPKVYFIRRIPYVSPIACDQIEEDQKNYAECFLQDPLKKPDSNEDSHISKFGLILDTKSLTDTAPLVLKAQVSIGSPSEEEKKDNNAEDIRLEVGRQANLEIRGTSATERNAIKADSTLLIDDKFLTSIKLEVRHQVSVLIEETDNKYGGGDTEGIKEIVVEINWPMRDHDGEYLLYLTEVYVKDNQMKGNFVVNSNVIDPDCLFAYNPDCQKHKVEESESGASAVSDNSEEVNPVAAATAAILNTNCTVPDPGCVKFNVTIPLLKAGSINMKDLEFEMRSVIWLKNVLNRADFSSFNATSTARIVSVGGGLVIPPGSFVEMKTHVYEDISKEKSVLWIIIGSVIGGVAILAILIVVLWKVGFFKRKMPPKDGSSE